MYKIIIGLGIGFLIGMHVVEDFFTGKIGAIAHSYGCEIPFDIPDTLANGQKTHWDCKWHSAYKEGRVDVLYCDNDAKKGARAIMMSSEY